MARQHAHKEEAAGSEPHQTSSKHPHRQFRASWSVLVSTGFLVAVLALAAGNHPTLASAAMHHTLSHPRLGGLQPGRSPAGCAQWASRVFRTTPAAGGAVRRPRAPAENRGCSADTCSAAGPRQPQLGGSQQRTRVVPRASHHVNAVTTTEASTKKQWWKANADLWEDVHDIPSFEAAVNSGDKLVLVDFFATWCHGCEKAYPELCKLAMDSDIRKKFKFVKVCIDELRALSKRENIKALPMLQIYRPGQGAIAQIDVPMSKIRHLRHNLQIITLNPGMNFQTDPNGFVVPIKADAAAQLQQQEAANKKEAAKLAASQGGLFSHLMNIARGTATPSGKDAATAAPAKAADTATSASAASSSSDASNGNGNGNGKVASQEASSRARLPGAIEIDQHAQMLEKQIFLNRSKADYGYNGRIDELYQREVGCRMRIGEHYMDYTGSSVYCQSQLEAAFTELRTCMFGNPHSANPSSSLTSERVEEVREIILNYFNADPTEYLVVFTRSATGALKLVGETFPWGPEGTFRYLRENHNSVLGIREYALEHGASFQAVDEKFVEGWLTGGQDDGTAVTPRAGTAANPTYNLFAFPAEDNFAGVKYPLRWVEAIKQRSTPESQWRVLIDAAAYVPTQPLDLRKVPADFVSLSFYKMFGYPTGLGALIVRTSAVDELRKVFWGGGTVALATSEDNFHVLKCRPTDKLEDGTVNFLDVIALKHGFNMLQQLGGITRVQSHVAALTEYLYRKLSVLKHSNGQPLLAVFGKHHFPNAREVQGGILNFEVLKPDGTTFSYKTFEREAADAGFHVRTGAECNPGACYNYLGVKEKEVEALAGTKEGCEDDVEFITVERPEGAGAAWASSTAPKVINSQEHLETLGNLSLLGHPAEVAMKWVEVPLGSVRVSLGYMSTFEDCYALVEFVKARYIDRAD